MTRYGLDVPGTESPGGGGGRIFCTHPDWLGGPPSLIYNGYQVFAMVKLQERGFDHPPPPSAKVRERVKLYLYSTRGPS